MGKRYCSGVGIKMNCSEWEMIIVTYNGNIYFSGVGIDIVVEWEFRYKNCSGIMEWEHILYWNGKQHGSGVGTDIVVEWEQIL